MTYKISNEALNDLEEIWLYTFKNWSVEQADKYIDLLIYDIEHLTKNPTAGKDYGSIRKGYFSSRVKSHLIFYKINLKAEKLEVIRILHKRMDLESQLENF